MQDSIHKAETMSTIVAPSLLSADFGDLRKDLEMINRSQADWLHLDIMDGVFVPNISFDFPVLKYVAKYCTKPLDLHLMIVEPEKFLERFHDEIGVTTFNVHYEACRHLNRTIYEIRNRGMKAAVTLNPSTPVCMLNDVIRDVDMVLLMTVNPGFGGQKFIEHSIDKVKELRRLISETGSHALIEVDGGVNFETAPRLVKAGVDVLVSGNTVFSAPDPEQAIIELKNLR